MLTVNQYNLLQWPANIVDILGEYLKIDKYLQSCSFYKSWFYITITKHNSLGTNIQCLINTNIQV